ncbi:MAG TPA: RdgB/HAM1 family non-canonical purine NTP pyrophosphatase [Chloroflexi bacterium]|nr:RdgB/HAM1 family non-canonical purine NTP pyrophosphatase [Chloroflexota bacterium]
MDLLVGTQNPGKMREYRALLASLPARVLFPADLGLAVEVTESGRTYAENACIKARVYARAIGQGHGGIAPLLVLADDSGLEVDGLDGAPGVRSARYVLGSDTDRLATLLAHLEGVPSERRTARFRCVIAIVAPQDELYTAEGTCEGVIATAPAGDGGFGYDPVFYLPEFGCTMAELPAQVKNRISHRARAVQAALPILRRLLAGDGWC